MPPRHYLWLLSLLLPLAAACAQNLLLNPGFEGPFTATGLPRGWADNSSWAKLTVSYHPERARPHSGNACLRINCADLSNGAVQMVPEAGVPLKKGTVYRVRGWLRGDVGLVALQLRLAPAPYTVYCEKSLEVREDWRKLDYLWLATVDDPQGRFMLRFSSPGNLYVDDLSVEALTAEQAAALQPPPLPGNLLLNGNFDLDRANWLMGIGCDDWHEAQLAVVGEQGNPCLRFTVPAGLRANLNSDIARVSQGHPVQVRCRLRAEQPVTVRVGTRRWGQQVALTPDWQTVTGQSLAVFDPNAVEVFSLTVTGPATVYLDDVELRQDGAQTPDSAAHAALISTRHPLGLYHDGETPTLRLLASVPAGHAPVPLDWTVEDYWGKVRAQGRAEARPGRLERSLPLKLTRGWYRARVRWREGDRDCLNESLFCLLPPPERKAEVATSPFGGHFAVTPSNLAVARAVGCRRLRLHPPNHTKWRIVEPEQGKWAWRDEPIQIALKQGLHLIGSLDRCPDWASSAPETFTDRSFYTGKGAWLPRDWAEWETYVTQTVRRYCKNIHLWEIWNEANLTSWLYPREGQTRAQAYYELLQHTTPIVRREDPQATVIAGVLGGSLTDGSDALKFTEELIGLGGLELMDVFSFHEYLGNTVDEGGDPLQEWIPRLRGLMRQAGRELPIINSEGGFYNPGSSLTYRPGAGDGVSPQTMARWMVRQYVAQLANGVNAFFFYNMFIDGSPVKLAWQGFVDGDGQPSPNVAAYAVMSWLLDRAKFQGTRERDGVWLHDFTTPRGLLTVAWAHSGEKRQVRLPGREAAWDLMGAPVAVPQDGVFEVTDAPLYVLSRETR